ncbi:MAG: MFS transporter [Labilithrix sp.]|nr:MFS transporter [Labilithrix sp.]MBX3223674.1 MFS transporter [Labilithrix sp.]
MNETFSRYQRFVVALLAFLQFTVVLDFMILSPLGAILMDELGVTTAQFGRVVSAYAFSAGISGLLAAGFADRFDRKKLLLFFYVGFVFGTLLCGVAPSYPFLLGARIVTGIFGGVIASISFAIVADLFPLSMRGRVMGLVQSSFAASQILGIPIGLYLATRLGWHAPFLMIVGVGVVAGIAIVLWLRPITQHLAAGAVRRSPVEHLLRTATRPRYLAGFSATILLAVGGFMLMPFGSTFLVQNLGVALETLPMVYVITGVSAMISGPLLGRVSDSFGKYRTFVLGSIVTAIVVFWYTRLSSASLGLVIALNILLFVGISARMVSSFALTSALPDLPDRGAYMAISSSLQQLAGGLASFSAGLVVHQATPTSPLEGYPTLGSVVVVALAVTMLLMFNVNLLVRRTASA